MRRIDESTHSGVLQQNIQFIFSKYERLVDVCETLTDSGNESKTLLNTNPDALNAKLEQVEERFAFGEVNRYIFEKVAGKIKKEIQGIKDEIKTSSFELSKPACVRAFWKLFQWAPHL